VSLCKDVEELPKVEKYRRHVLDRAGKAALVRALAPKGSRELPASALQKPTSVRRLGRAACGGSAAQPLCVFSGTHTRTTAASRTRNADPHPSILLAASKPPTRRSVHIRAASSTRLKPRDGATRFRRREQHLCQPPEETLNKPSTRRRDTSNLKIPAKATPKY
jgi:hypothetical protein